MENVGGDMEMMLKVQKYENISRDASAVSQPCPKDSHPTDSKSQQCVCLLSYIYKPLK